MSVEPMNSTRQRPVRTLVIAGVGAGALIITVLVSLSTSLLNDNANLVRQLVAAEGDLDKAAEKMTVTRYDALSVGDGSNIKIKVSNNGQLSTAYQYVLLYCISNEGCPANPGVPIINALSIEPAPPIVLGPGESREFQVGPVADGLTYRVDVITERGNILSTGECTTDLARQICEGPSEAVEIQ